MFGTKQRIENTLCHYLCNRQWRTVSSFRVCSSTIFAGRMQPFIKQMFGSARKFIAITRTNIKRLFKQPNLLLNVSNFGASFLAFAISKFSS